MGARGQAHGQDRCGQCGRVLARGDRAIQTREVATKLGLITKSGSVESFYRKRRKLEALGFPKPLPGFKNHWSLAAVDAWILSNQPHEAEASGGLDPAGLEGRLEANLKEMLKGL